MPIKLRYPLNETMITERLNFMRDAVDQLKDFQKYSKEEFCSKENLYCPAADTFLRKALQAMLDIAGHIVTRIPGAKPREYKEDMQALIKHKIISSELAPKALAMAGYRNRMIHFYYEITPEELYGIIQDDLPDLEEYIKQISQFVLDHKEDKKFTMKF